MHLGPFANQSHGPSPKEHEENTHGMHLCTFKELASHGHIICLDCSQTQQPRGLVNSLVWRFTCTWHRPLQAQLIPLKASITHCIVRKCDRSYSLLLHRVLLFQCLLIGLASA